MQVPPEIAIRKADNHTLKYWSELSLYSENGEWSIDKNVANNAIRPFVIVRKAWLFGNSQLSAKASAALYSLIETVKANQQEPLILIVLSSASDTCRPALSITNGEHQVVINTVIVMTLTFNALFIAVGNTEIANPTASIFSEPEILVAH